MIFSYRLQREVPLEKPLVERVADALMEVEDTRTVEIPLDVECDVIENEVRGIEVRDARTGRPAELTPDEEAEVMKAAEKRVSDGYVSEWQQVFRNRGEDPPERFFDDVEMDDYREED